HLDGPGRPAVGRLAPHRHGALGGGARGARRWAMTTNGRVSLAVADGVAGLRLVRAEARNAIDPAMVTAPGAAVQACAADPVVRGAIAGGGLGLAWVADLVLAAEDAVFATGFAQIGLSGDGGSSWFLPRLVGLRRAQELVIGGRILTAAEALDWGLITRVVPR